MAGIKMDSLLRVFLWGQVFQLDQEFPVKEKQVEKWLKSGIWNVAAPREFVSQYILATGLKLSDFYRLQ